MFLFTMEVSINGGTPSHHPFRTMGGYPQSSSISNDGIVPFTKTIHSHGGTPMTSWKSPCDEGIHPQRASTPPLPAQLQQQGGDAEVVLLEAKKIPCRYHAVYSPAKTGDSSTQMVTSRARVLMKNFQKPEGMKAGYTGLNNQGTC